MNKSFFQIWRLRKNGCPSEEWAGTQNALLLTSRHLEGEIQDVYNTREKIGDLTLTLNLNECRSSIYITFGVQTRPAAYSIWLTSPCRKNLSHSWIIFFTWLYLSQMILQLGLGLLCLLNSLLEGQVGVVTLLLLIVIRLLKDLMCSKCPKVRKQLVLGRYDDVQLARPGSKIF